MNRNMDCERTNVTGECSLQPNLWGKEHFNDDGLKFGTDGYGEQ